jgi:hypothetical protein
MGTGIAMPMAAKLAKLTSGVTMYPAIYMHAGAAAVMKHFVHHLAD